MSSPIDLASILDLEQLSPDVFRGQNPPTAMRRVFGGLVLGQAMMAAARTAEGVLPHSLHAYFLLAGDPALPIDYEVDRIRDGRSFRTRRVVARQRDRAIFSTSISFHNDEPDELDHQIRMPDVPHPDQLPSLAEIREKILPELPPAVGRYYQRERPIDLRPVDFSRYRGKRPDGDRFSVWLRATAALPDDQALHRSALAYASDMNLLDAALVPHQRSVFDTEIMGASLDHALWFHRPFRADQWLLYVLDSPSLHGARGFGRGLIFTENGTLVASAAQEGLLRLRRPAPSGPG